MQDFSNLISSNNYSVVPIGKVSSPFKQKFTVPRQPRLLNLAKGVITLNKPFNDPLAVEKLSSFSHIWVLFWFHLNPENKSASAEGYKWQPMVKPPRLGGKEKVGVFATRSPFRPNPIGLSVYELAGVEYIDQQVKIYINGVDVVDNTPVIDIKPYIPFSDSIPDACGSFATDLPHMPFSVKFSSHALNALFGYILADGQSIEYANEVKNFIEQLLSQDPRPAHLIQKYQKQDYGVDIMDYNVKWILNDTEVYVTEILLR